MRAIRKKLRSRTGASVAFALLLFLICAVVGSVVLTAGTAASGRMSRVAELDQKYYSVNSAARLLIDTITADEVKVEKTTTTVSETEKTVSYKFFRNGTEVNDLANPNPSLTIDTARVLYESPSILSTPRNVTIATTQSTALTVTGTETISPDGSMSFVLTNNSGSDREEYRIHIEFVTEKKSSLRVLDIENNTETETTTIKWKLGDIWQDPVDVSAIAG